MNPYELNETNQKLLLEAYEFNKQNKLPQTIEQLDKILLTEKNYIIISNIYYFKARALTELNRQGDALKFIEDGLRYNATNSFLLYLKAKIVTEMDHSSSGHDQAIKYFRQAEDFSRQAQINFKESAQALRDITDKIPVENLSDFVPTINDMRFLESNIRTMLGPLLVLKNTKDGFEAVKKDFEKVVTDFSSKIETIEEKVDKERTRTIELLGLFTAVIAFIFSSIHFASNFKNIPEAMIAIIGLGAVLLLFLLTLHFVLDDIMRGKFLRGLFMILGIVIVLILILVYANKYVGPGETSSSTAPKPPATESEPIDKARATTDKASKPETARAN